MSAKSAHDFSFRAIDGGELPLSDFKGKALLVVNVASRCGLTPQYTALEKLWTARRGEGLVVLGVPANDFGAQEPGTEEEIRNFCDLNYHVDFPLTAKEHVIGPDAHPLYKWVAAELGEDTAPKWNFHKYLFNPDGSIAGTFGSRTPPDAAEISAAIDTALAR
jgi:glutathione peroxidase